MWGAVIAAAASVFEAQELQREMRSGGFIHVDRVRDIQFIAPAYTPKQSKCESCGARDWVAHDGKEVCAYCRGDRS